MPHLGCGGFAHTQQQFSDCNVIALLASHLQTKTKALPHNGTPLKRVLDIRFGTEGVAKKYFVTIGVEEQARPSRGNISIVIGPGTELGNQPLIISGLSAEPLPKPAFYRFVTKLNESGQTQQRLPKISHKALNRRLLDACRLCQYLHWHAGRQGSQGNTQGINPCFIAGIASESRYSLFQFQPNLFIHRLPTRPQTSEQFPQRAPTLHQIKLYAGIASV
ncbi:MAG: hypothetical protein IPJ38_15705 [Dechloromonas sp.]|uniref:Uncharacterized protein n=1 Tax=Candidatus Dechloromonas phosphorivorans TaxID=2899244 RepID=A0A935K4Q8_9RHOO|nr:hypothetical protein [Candidatus Dechloromonas phosphorivorans]